MSLTRKPARPNKPSIVPAATGQVSSAPVTPVRSANTSSISASSGGAARTRTKLICLYDFAARSPDDLAVMRGEWVYADMDDQLDPDWLWAYHPGTKRSGFLPRTYARPPGGGTAAMAPRRGSHDDLSRRSRDPYLSPWNVLNLHYILFTERKPRSPSTSSGERGFCSVNRIYFF